VIAFKLASGLTDVPFEVFSRDPTTLAGMRSYTGVLSNFGAVLWVAAGSVALLSGVVLYRSQQPRRSHLLLGLGGLTFVLAFDDLLLLHESVVPFLGVPQRVIVSGYPVVLGLLILRYRGVVRATPVLLLGLSCALFGVSLGLDQFSSVDRYVIEDGSKLVGIVSWLLYLTITSLRWLEYAATGAHGPHGSGASATGHLPEVPADPVRRPGRGA
jgi:hypothetical protein